MNLIILYGDSVKIKIFIFDFILYYIRIVLLSLIFFFRCFYNFIIVTFISI